jgi:hypothetical protein
VAIEIPSLAADRLPHPEWGPATQLGRSALPAGRLLVALDGASAPAVVLDGLKAAAAASGSVELLLSPDRGLVQIVLDGRRIPLAGAARDAVLILLGEIARGDEPGRAPATASGALDPSQAGRIAAVGAQVQESRAQAGSTLAGEVQSAEPASTVVLATPLMTGPDAGEAGRSLARAVDASGLFLEAHVAQWLRGKRPLGQVLEEARSLPPVVGGAHAAASESRASRQLEAQQNQLVRLQAPAWPGQLMDLQIAREPERRADAAGAGDEAGLFQATLSLELPRLGTLHARIRLLHDTVGLQLAAQQTALLLPALQDLSTALSARGLTLAALELAPAGAGPRDLPGP